MYIMTFSLVGLGKLCWHNFEHNSFIYLCQHNNNLHEHKTVSCSNLAMIPDIGPTISKDQYAEEPSCLKGARYLLTIHELLVAMGFFPAGV